jgi:hypothetical protein
MPISLILVTQYFQLVAKRQFAEAERILERMKLKTEKTERNRGYLQALHGILLSNKSNNDQYAFLSNISLNDKTALEKHRREFLKHARNSLHAEYDRGFFSAWADFTRVLLKLENIPEPQVVHAETQYVAPEESTEKEPSPKVEEVKSLKFVQTNLGRGLNSDS